MIEKTIKELKAKVKDSDIGHLPLNERVNLLTLLNDITIVNKILFECVKKVYPIWEKQYPKNETMIDLLNKSNEFLYEGIGNKKDFIKYNDIETFEKDAKNSLNLTGEFEMYPRAKEFTPQWWQDILGKKAKYKEGHSQMIDCDLFF